MLEFLESTGVTETPGVTQLVTFGWFGTEAVCMFWLNGLARWSGPEAPCFTELVMFCKIGTKMIWSPVWQNFTVLKIFEVTVVTEAPNVIELVTFVCSGTVGSPKRGSTEAACVTDLARRQNIRTEVN